MTSAPGWDQPMSGFDNPTEFRTTFWKTWLPAVGLSPLLLPKPNPDPALSMTFAQMRALVGPGSSLIPQPWESFQSQLS